jgi:hypothetical protein
MTTASTGPEMIKNAEQPSDSEYRISDAFHRFD